MAWLKPECVPHTERSFPHPQETPGLHNLAPAAAHLKPLAASKPPADADSSHRQQMQATSAALLLNRLSSERQKQQQAQASKGRKQLPVLVRHTKPYLSSHPHIRQQIGQYHNNAFIPHTGISHLHLGLACRSGSALSICNA